MSSHRDLREFDGVRPKMADFVGFIGRKALFAFCLSVVAGLLLSVVEGGFTAFLQLFLKELGILTEGAKIHRPFARVDFSPIQLAICLVFMGCLRAGALLLTNQSAAFAQSGVRMRLIAMGVRKSLRSSGDRIWSAAELNHRLLETYPRVSEFFQNLSLTISTLITSLLLMILMFRLAPREAPIGILSLGMVGLLSLKSGKRIRVAADRATKEVKELAEGAQRVSRNRFLIRVFRTEHWEEERIQVRLQRMYRALLRSGFLWHFSSVVPQVLGIAVIGGLVLIHQTASGTSGLDFLGFLYAFLRFVNSLSGLSSGLGGMNMRFPEFRSAFIEYLEEKRIKHSDSRAELLEVESSDAPAGSPARVEISELSFGFKNREKRLFDDFTLAVQPGEHLGIMGKSGSGKSTLLALILGLLPPESGSVTIDGVAPRDYFVTPGNRVGYVGSEPYLFFGTLRENLSYGFSGLLPEERCYDLLTRVGLDSVVKALPDKLDFLIHEDGHGLSSGQRQRIGLARALARNPRLLILDEASSNLDENSESEIARLLKRLTPSCTILNVTHRRGLIAYADRVLSLEH